MSLAGLVIGVGVAALYGLHQAGLLKAGMNAQIADDECVSCASKDLETIAPEAYRCRACGYEGGVGLVALQDAAADARVDGLSPEHRKREAIADLADAKSVLLAVTGTMQSVLSLSRRDIVGFGTDAGREKQQAFIGALGEMQRAQNSVKAAARKLGWTPGHDPDPTQSLGIDFNSAGFALDICLDDVFSNLHVHDKIKAADRYAAQMLSAVEEALKRVVAS